MPNFVVRYLGAAILAFILALALTSITHADSPNGKHGGHPPIVSNGQGQVGKGNDPVPHVNYGLHKGQNKGDNPTDPPSQTIIDPPTSAVAPSIKGSAPITNTVGTKELPLEVTAWYMGGGGIPQAD